VLRSRTPAFPCSVINRVFLFANCVGRTDFRVSSCKLTCDGEWSVGLWGGSKSFHWILDDHFGAVGYSHCFGTGEGTSKQSNRRKDKDAQSELEFGAFPDEKMPVILM